MLILAWVQARKRMGGCRSAPVRSLRRRIVDISSNRGGSSSISLAGDVDGGLG